MKNIFYYLVMSVLLLCGCNNQPSQLKLIDTPELYSSIEEGFYIVKTINDSMGFAVDDISWVYDEKEPECVLVSNELIYDGKCIIGFDFDGEWYLIGTWNEKGKIYPVIKFHEYDSIEMLMRNMLYYDCKSEEECDSIAKEYEMLYNIKNGKQ